MFYLCVISLCLQLYCIIFAYVLVHTFAIFMLWKKRFVVTWQRNLFSFFFLHYFFNFFFIIFYVFFYCFFQLFLYFLLIVKNKFNRKERKRMLYSREPFFCDFKFFFDFKISLKLKKLEIKKNLFYFYQKWLCTYFTV